jgi:hypothetical protein
MISVPIFSDFLNASKKLPGGRIISGREPEAKRDRINLLQGVAKTAYCVIVNKRNRGFSKPAILSGKPKRA